jgi:hypothetical protein
MISAARIATVFRKKGRSGTLTKLASEFTLQQISPVLDELGDEIPLIVSMRSCDEWFAFTKSYLLSKYAGTLRRVRLDTIHRISGNIRDHAEAKRNGGKLEVELQDGSSASVTVESGGTYVALYNVFQYLVQVSGPRSNKPMMGSGQPRPTTNDRRPTTHL